MILAVARRSAVSIAKTISMGLGSGLSGGRNGVQAPLLRIVRSAHSLLWLDNRAAYRYVDNPRCFQSIALVAGHEGLGSSGAERSLAVQPFASPGPATLAGHFGRGAGLVDEDQPVVLLAHDGLAGILPIRLRRGQFRAVLFACCEGFFEAEPEGEQELRRAGAGTSRPFAVLSSFASSGMVMSPRTATISRITPR